ncbi:hypothetical protein [Bradyrhizobium sp. Arg816]|uniref:hypothetical protein n=1 Tax=Bradyrhizobium sp. Arg816 TaxID=2998491 RepID=UPI00249F06C2|nr:hypothetical protein [Bradyrhizobium sp. Arg816]MDI3566507.1 hypothetical protein [Bradyrhizobium sp. Arg816]
MRVIQHLGSRIFRNVLFATTITCLAPTHGHAASGCAPGSTCLSVTGKGVPAPEPAPFIAQCTGVFPDFVTPSAMVPSAGPWFKLSQSYPTAVPANDATWSNIDFKDGVTGANAYLYALRDYAFDGMIDADFKPEANNVRPWFHMPLMNFGPRAREPMRGLTSERSVTGPELGLKPGVTIHNYAVGFYNAAGAVTIGQVLGGASPDLAKAQFPQGAMTFKILFSDVTANDFQGSDVLSGAPQWTIRTAAGPQTVRLMQMDVAAVDSRSPTGWVFGTFAFDSNATDTSPWRRLRPVGLSWGNDFGFTPADQQAGKKLTETTISDQAPAYSASHLGWAGRANGPVDNPISGCLSCHSTAQSPSAPITFSNACTTDAQKMLWFRDLKGNQPFGGVDASCNPITSAPPPKPLDFSLQLSVAVQNVVQFGDVNPCSPSASIMNLRVDDHPGEHPRIAR